MDKIPVTFEYKGKWYKGTLEEVKGGGNPNVWHLMINKFYCGQMHYYGDMNEFRFTSQTGEFEELNDYFAAVVIAWYE